MKIPKQLSQHQKDHFLNGLFDHLQHFSFGSVGKRDMDCLLLHCLLESGVLHYTSNRELANKLGINETKLKSYLIDIRYKFGEDEIDDNIHTVINKILVHQDIKISHDGNNFIFALENPVYRADLEKKMKDLGYYADTSFNKEIVKIRDYAFIAFIFRFHQFDNSYVKLNQMFKTLGDIERDLLTVLKGDKSWLDKSRELLGQFGEDLGHVQLLFKVIRLVTLKI